MGQPGATGDSQAGAIDAVQWPIGLDPLHTTFQPVEVISYSFQTSQPADLTYLTGVSGFTAYSAAERAAVRAALDHYEEMINVRFVEQSTELSIDMTFLKASQGLSGGYGGFQYSYFPLEYEGFALFNSNRDVSQPSAMSLILHEIGHAMTLKHPGPYDVDPTNIPPGPYLPEDQDNSRFTLMSYNPNPQSGEDADSLMLYDIAALQERWGANLTTRTGADTYTAPAVGDLEAIWDAGGYDTISAAGTTEDMVIDLRQAHFSSYGGLDRLVVGYNVVIEAAQGSSGNDTLQGNYVANRLIGGGGNDTLYGRDGADFLGGGAGADRMEGGLGNDFYIVDNLADQVIETLTYSQGGGIDTVRTYADGYVQPDNVELVRLGVLTGQVDLSATGNDAPGTLVGNAGNNTLTARGGNDQVNGNGGDDTLIGNTGRDTLVGGAGGDTFVYSSISETRAGSVNRDVINGFDRGADVIDLGAMDANLGLPGDAFTFIGTGRFSGTAGELRLQGLGGPNAVLVEGDVRGDGVADFQIFVNLTTVLSASDFIL